jgi:hypothetical protein
MNFTNDSVNLRGGASGVTQLSDQPIRFAGSELGAKRHICAFFHNRDEEYRVLLPFIKEGLKRGEKAFHVVDPKLREEHIQRLNSAGIDVAAKEKSRHLELRNWAETYLREGHFDQDGMLALAQEVIEGGSQQGFALTRVVAHMEWALGDQPGVDDLLEYETRLNYILPQYKDPVICTYDLARFGGNVVVDIMRTHPMIIIGGVVQENPFFVPPDEFLRELAQRDATPDA